MGLTLVIFPLSLFSLLPHTCTIFLYLQEMADYVRTADPNHLVTSGSEGFFGEGDPNVSKNPQPWAKQTGQNFVDDNRHMDFAVTHAWPDNWFM